MNKKLVWAGAGIVLVAIVIVGAVVGLRGIGQKSAEGHVSVTQARLQVATLQGRDIRIAGTVVPGSLNWDAREGVSEFLLADSGDRIQVTYKGVMPSGFKPGGRLAVDGRLASDGSFEASDIPSNAFCTVCHP